MQYAAQVQATIEILEDTAEHQRPVDRVIAFYFKNHRYIGSKDKKAISGLVYQTLRSQGLIDWSLKDIGLQRTPRLQVAANLVLGESADIYDVFTGEQYSPTELTADEKQVAHIWKTAEKAPIHAQYNYPKWLENSLTEAFGDNLPEAMAALNVKAPTNVRLNTLKGSTEDLIKALEEEGLSVYPTSFSPEGLHLPEPGNLFGMQAFSKGLFEVQDTGSQLVALLCGAKKGSKVTDFCAGAGGKTLALAAMMQNKGMLTVGDIIPKKLDELRKRLRRAGADNVIVRLWEDGETWIKRHKRTQDTVLLDVPCSGSGVWRRNPDAKWSLNQKRLDELCTIQKDIIDNASRLVKVGGRLVYATCSILHAENEVQIERFLSSNKDFKMVPIQTVWQELAAEGVIKDECPVATPTLRLAPHTTDTDGFFVAILERTE